MTDIKELEKMPTLYLNFLIHILSPLTQYLVCVIDILTWKNPNHSLLVVLLFNSVCIRTQRWLAFGLPCLLFVERIHVRCLITRRRCGSNDIGDEEIKRTRATGYEVEDTLHRLELIQSWWTHCYWKTDILPCISLMTLNLVTLTSALIYVWPIWCMTNYFLLGSHRVIAAGGTWILVFNSNWYQALLYAIKKNYLFMLVEHNVALITYFFSRSSSSSKKKKELTGESNHQTSMTLPSFPRMISANQRHEIYRCEVPTTRI